MGSLKIENVKKAFGPVEVLKTFQDQGVISHLGVASGPIDLEIRYVETGLFDAPIRPAI